MKDNILVSIIVPVYNAEKYLKECISTLINQTYKNIEIILVNDGSCDSSYQLMREYEKKYENVTALTQTNKGSSMARAKGIKKATGDYIMFVDADDWIEKDAVDKLVEILKEKKYDNIRFLGILEPSKTIKNPYDFQMKSQKELTKKEVYQLLLETKTLHNLCFGIYKTSILKEIPSFQSSLSFAEDYWANLDILTKANSVLMINEILYHYRENPSSVTKKIAKERIIKNTEDAIFVYSKLMNYLKEWKMDTMENRAKASLSILDITRWSIFNLFKIKNIDRVEMISLLRNTFDKEIFIYIRENIPFNKIKKELTKKKLKYRIKNTINIKMIYKRKYNFLWLNKYLFQIKYR